MFNSKIIRQCIIPGLLGVMTSILIYILWPQSSRPNVRKTVAKKTATVKKAAAKWQPSNNIYCQKWLKYYKLANPTEAVDRLSNTIALFTFFYKLEGESTDHQKVSKLDLLMRRLVMLHNENEYSRLKSIHQAVISHKTIFSQNDTLFACRAMWSNYFAYAPLIKEVQQWFAQADKVLSKHHMNLFESKFLNWCFNNRTANNGAVVQATHKRMQLKNVVSTSSLAKVKQLALMNMLILMICYHHIRSLNIILDEIDLDERERSLRQKSKVLKEKLSKLLKKANLSSTTYERNIVNDDAVVYLNNLPNKGYVKYLMKSFLDLLLPKSVNATFLTRTLTNAENTALKQLLYLE